MEEASKQYSRSGKKIKTLVDDYAITRKSIRACLARLDRV